MRYSITNDMPNINLLHAHLLHLLCRSLQCQLSLVGFAEINACCSKHKQCFICQKILHAYLELVTLQNMCNLFLLWLPDVVSNKTVVSRPEKLRFLRIHDAVNRYQTIMYYCNHLHISSFNFKIHVSHRSRQLSVRVFAS